MVFILLYIFIFESSTPSPNSWVYNIESKEQWNPNWNKYQESLKRLQIAFPLVQLNTCASGNLPKSKSTSPAKHWRFLPLKYICLKGYSLRWMMLSASFLPIPRIRLIPKCWLHFQAGFYYEGSCEVPHGTWTPLDTSKGGHWTPLSAFVRFLLMRLKWGTFRLRLIWNLRGDLVLKASTGRNSMKEEGKGED